MSNRFVRTQALLGLSGLEKLQKSKVLIAGLGGVGGWAAEALARSGIGALALFDKDVVEASNINRQTVALEATLGLNKYDAALLRLKAINPLLKISGGKFFVNKNNVLDILRHERPDFVIDAIDSVGPKSQLLAACADQKITALSCLGAASKLDPFGFEVGDLFAVTHCPLARALRKALRRLGLRGGVVSLFSSESPKLSGLEVSAKDGSKFLGSYAPVVAVSGFLAADYAVKTLVGMHSPAPEGKMRRNAHA